MAATHSVALNGLTGRPIEVEVDVSSGMPGTVVVGLADTIVNEARDRVRAAVVNSGTSWPDQRVTINLAPSSLPKTGSHFDLSSIE
jgi:magnesium chelatase family protein